ncbi:hypothetical protein ACFX15_045136 [Malus domestica]
MGKKHLLKNSANAFTSLGQLSNLKTKWSKLVDRFELRENEWVHSLYEDRKKWAPTYMQDLFLVGLSTKERSGSKTSFFDGYISQEATFKDFVEQYKAFCKDSYDMKPALLLKHRINNLD